MPKCPHCPADYSTEQELRVHRSNAGDHVVERLRSELSWALSVIEHEVDPPVSCGACGTPLAQCDGTCVDAAYHSQHMRAIRVLVGAKEHPTTDRLLDAVDEARGGPAPTPLKGYA